MTGDPHTNVLRIPMSDMTSVDTDEAGTPIQDQVAATEQQVKESQAVLGFKYYKDAVESTDLWAAVDTAGVCWASICAFSARRLAEACNTLATAIRDDGLRAPGRRMSPGLDSDL